MRKLLLNIFLLSATVTASATSYTKADTLWTGKPYVTDVRALLTGQMPGVVVTSSLGAPGMTPSVFIQGYHVDNQQPVYIVDGMRVLHLDTLAPDSIDNIMVLTGAKAMALYGPAAKNGAIVVKTKSAGRNGFHASYGFTGALQQLAWEPQPLTWMDWLHYYPELDEAAWMSPLKNAQFETSFVQTHHLDLQYRHNDKFSAAATFDFLDNDGPSNDRLDAQQRFSGSARIEYKPLRWLRAEVSATLGKSDASRSNAMHRYLLNLPLGVRYSNNELQYFERHLEEGERTFKDFTGNALVEVRPVSGLTVRAHAGYSAQRAEDNFIELENQEWIDGDYAIKDWKYFQYDLETQYQRSFGSHTLSANLLLRGQSVVPEELTFSVVGLDIKDYQDKYLQFVKDLDQDHLPYNYFFSSFKPEKPITWGDGHLSLTYDYAHLLTLGLNYYLLRADNNGQKVTYHVPSAQATWKMGQTRFMRKILPRWWTGWSWNAAWSGTDNHKQYYSYSLPIFVGKENVLEPFSRLEIGTDLQMGNFNLNASWFSGRESIGSLPDILNQGWTFAADWTGRSGDFIFAAGLNAALYKNKCLSSDPEQVYFINPSQPVFTGHPLGTKMLYPFIGIDYEGNPHYKTTGDRTDQELFEKGPFPTATLGVHFDMQWRRWTFNLVAHGNFGQSIMRAVEYGRVDENHDMLTRHYMTESWSGSNWKGKYPKPSSLTSYDMFYSSSAMLHDGSFFRIDQIRLQYRLPIRRLHTNVRLSAALENFFLFTKYPGSDPEYNLSWDNPGYDLGAYPSTRRIVFGVNIDL